MRYNIAVTNQAQADMDEIFNYIAFELQSVQNASGLLDKLEHSILSLAEMPERFQKYSKEPWKSRNLRVMPVKKYLVFYIVDNANHLVTVLRVLYGARDMDSELMPDA